MFRKVLIQICTGVHVEFVISLMTLAWTSDAGNVHALPQSLLFYLCLRHDVLEAATIIITGPYVYMFAAYRTINCYLKFSHILCLGLYMVGFISVPIRRLLSVKWQPWLISGRIFWTNYCHKLFRSAFKKYSKYACPRA